MKKNTISIVGLFICFSLIFTGCKDDDKEDTCSCTTGKVELTIVPTVNGQELEMGKVMQDNQSRDYWFTTLKFYLSNLKAVAENGEIVNLVDVAYFDFEPNQSTGAKNNITADIANGTYTAIQYDAGVRQDLNEKDPATFANDHPLSINNNMYWSWSTQYIFTKTEGFVVDNGDNKAWFVHCGLEENYEANRSVPVSFTVTGGSTTTATITLNLDKVLESPHTIDLVADGQSHTTDNMELAANYQENFSVAFE
jgi:hypothetical protein